MGRFFTYDVAVSNDQAVVERGPYRWLRHPSYLTLLPFAEDRADGFGLIWCSFYSGMNLESALGSALVGLVYLK